MSSRNLLLPEKNIEEPEGSEGSAEEYTPPQVPGLASNTEQPEGITRGVNGSVQANSYRARPNLDESPIVAAPNSTNYQELPEGPPPPASNAQPSKNAVFQAPVTTVTTGGSPDSTNKIIAAIFIGALLTGIAVLYQQFPSYGNTILNGFVQAAIIFGGVILVITSICIMMNIYKPDGFAITLFAGWLGMIGAWVIVPIYTVYHTFWPIQKRPYFGLFPVGWSAPNWGLVDMFLEPFHDGITFPRFKDMLKAAHISLYGSST